MTAGMVACNGRYQQLNISPRVLKDTHNEHHNTDNACRKEGDCIGGETQSIKDLGSVVQNGVDAGPLLEKHGD